MLTPEGAVERPARVLVVDDDDALARLWPRVLSRAGFHVRAAPNAEQALELAQTFRPRLALLDLGLPRMDGHELGCRLRAAHAGIVLVAITGFDQPSVRERSRACGFAVHLVKPMRGPDLVEVVRAYCGRARAR